jgi:hypothetical protein
MHSAARGRRGLLFAVKVGEVTGDYNPKEMPP